MVTTIQISDELRALLVKRKLNSRETFEGVIFDLIEDTLELSEQAKRDLEEAEKDVAAGRVFTHDEVKKELGL